MYEKLGRHDALLLHLMESSQHEAVVRLCRQMGKQMPHLWLEAMCWEAKGLEEATNGIWLPWGH